MACFGFDYNPIAAWLRPAGAAGKPRELELRELAGAGELDALVGLVARELLPYAVWPWSKAPPEIVRVWPS